MLSRMLPDQRVLVAGSPGESTFALEIQNEFNENPGIWFPRFDPDVNDLDAGISRLGENFGAQYTEDQMWGLDILWRHVLDYFEWKGSNWKVSALSGVRVIQTSDNFQLFWNRNTVPGWDPFGNDPVFF